MTHGGYQVSNTGLVKNPAGELRGYLDRNGYVRVKIKGRTYKVHNLVLELFVGPRPSGLVARHLDDVKDNNHVSNLKWGTQKENVADIITNGNNARLNTTHCPANHEYTEENTYVNKGRRTCKECQRIRSRRWKRSKQ
ncbi:hypothetical protein SEA_CHISANAKITSUNE_96 [Gordonia phage ChisanaKitsune]|uniref:HNH nuclease domain-containing protein n=1 Tax=Gordonia phage ChisanaKitsune TaxID=2871538 RepID=A0AAE7XFR1_9CAUD|nr:HNH endonuclease [Gordonia phage ChisanaKitsune]QZE10860.1 hypothetical protein SEA_CHISANAKITSUNE_96 [Gordonia phage ChisanaKitsune]